ncbi:MAG TPA: ATP-binding protein [Candidatus Acidoferrum sp.]|nr:ATP-binding protein [Candidatus Acidoferrum sp.]
MKETQPPRRGPWLGWQWKAIIPIVGVLLLGLIAFQAVVVALDIPSGHWIVIVAAAGAVAICFVTLTVLLVLIERPLEELKKIIGRVREGDLSAKVEFSKRNDDVGQLGRQFNEMIQELAENRSEIERLHQGEMARAEHLATIGELAAGLAHEIRNPLAGIAGVVEVMGRELPKESSSLAVLPEVQNEIQHIQAILSDLLAYARPRLPEFHPADLNATVEQAVFLARQQVRTKPIEITLEPDKKLPRISHDPVQIQQVVLNLLLNGIQAVQSQGKIEVALRQEGECAVIRIRDTGKGIPHDSLPKIFKPFFTTRKEGTGLGLPLAKGIVESHNGKIEVTSVPGQGAQFEVWLPILRHDSKSVIG